MEKTRPKPLSLMKRSSDFLYDHFKAIVVWLIAGIVITDLFSSFYPGLRIALFIFFSVCFIILVPNFIVHKGLRSIRNLIGNQEITIGEIIVDYCLAALTIILFFAMLYGVAETVEIGRLQYGSCGDTFKTDLGQIDYSELSTTPTTVSHFDTIYFSAITFFTVGYGDICPMGVHKLLSILNAWAGVLINIIVISVAIGQYLNSGRNSKKEEND